MRPKTARVALLLACAMIVVGATPVVAASGDLDPSFGVGGIASSGDGCGGSCTFAVDVARLADGRLAAIGMFATEGAWYFGARATGEVFSADGAHIAGFHGGPGDVSSPWSIVPHPDGGAVMVGVSQRCITGDVYDEEPCPLTRAFFLVVKYTPDLGGDPTFDVDGSVLTPVGEGDASAHDVAIQPDGKIVVVGWAMRAGVPALAVVRYLPSGALDASFGNRGRVLIANATGGGVAIAPDGKIVIAGTRNDRFLVLKLRSNGSLDTTFSGDGATTAGFQDAPASATRVLLDATGRIVVGGSASVPWGAGSRRSTAVMRFLSGGALDPSFDGDGKVRTTFLEGDAGTWDILIDPSGRIVAGGGQGLVRYRTGGRLDAAFSGDGMLWAPWSIDGLLQQGSRYVVGFDGEGGIALARFLG